MIDKILHELELCAGTNALRIFGSVARGEADPKDLDVVLIIPERRAAFKPHEHPLAVTLLRLSRQHYGWLDPFLRLEDTLLVRDDRATGWIRAQNAVALLRAMDQDSVSFADVMARPRTHNAPRP